MDEETEQEQRLFEVCPRCGYPGDRRRNNKTKEYVGAEDLNQSRVLELKNDVLLPGVGRWDIPELRPDMWIDEDVEIRLWGEEDVEGAKWMWNYNSDSTVGMEWRRTIVGFYVSDERFEAMWADTAGRISALVNRNIYGMITPNFSAYYDWPGALRLWNTFRSRWVGRFAQEAGIRIVPDISGSPKDFDFIFDGLPKKKICSIQIHRERKETAWEKNKVIEKLIETLEPPVLWVYGQQEKKDLYPALNDVKVRWITPRTKLRRRYFETKTMA